MLLCPAHWLNRCATSGTQKLEKLKLLHYRRPVPVHTERKKISPEMNIKKWQATQEYTVCFKVLWSCFLLFNGRKLVSAAAFIVFLGSIMYCGTQTPTFFFSVKACYEYFEGHYLVAVTTVISEKFHGVEEVNDGTVREELLKMSLSQRNKTVRKWGVEVIRRGRWETREQMREG